MAKKALLLVVLPLLLLIALAEGLGYGLGGAGEKSPTAAFNERFYVYDRDLVVGLRPGLRDDFKDIRPDLDATVTINKAGFRGEPWNPPDPEALRILVLGDSVTFGLGVHDEEAWPAVCARLLGERAPDKAIQVRNLAVPGYSTFQGRIMFERHALGGVFDPHLVVFAFGFNDGFLRAHDDALAREGQRYLHESWGGRVRQWLTAHSHFFAWLWRDEGGPPDRPTCRVSQQDLRENLEAVATAAARAQIELVLVDASLPHSYARDAMTAVAARHGLGWLAFREVFRQHKGLAAEGMWPKARRLRLAVRTGGQPLPEAPGGGPRLAALLVPNAAERPSSRRVAMNDDGRDGDPVAGDGTWSCMLDIEQGSRPELAFAIPGFADQIAAMRNDAALLNGFHQMQPGPRPLDAPGATATLTLDAAALLQPPWPDLVLAPDVIHASPAGCRLMADAVAKAIQASKSWR